MKVHFGKYHSTISCSKLHQKYICNKHKISLTDYYLDNYTPTKFDTLVLGLFGFIDLLLDNTVNNIIRKIKRKEKVVIHDYDTWNVDITLAMIIHPLLLKYKEQEQRFFTVDPSDVPETHHNIDEDIQGEISSEWVLNEMIWTFNEILTEENRNQAFEDGVFYKDVYEKHESRMDNGQRLFGKYFRALWT